MRATTCVLIAICAAPVAAQTNQVTTPPPNFVIPNPNGVPAGPFGGLESVAFVARASDPSAAWFNPAGLTNEPGSQISGSAGIYQLVKVTPEGLPNSGGSVQQVPNSVGFTVRGNEQLTLGFALVTTTAWEQETTSQLVNTIALGEQRFALAADSGLTRRIAALSAGYTMAGPWRLGGGLAFEYDDMSVVQSVSDRIADPTTLRTLLVTTHASGSALQLRSVFGVQYDRTALRAGVALRTPALALMRSGSITLDGTLDAGQASLGASLFDPDARFAAQLPWEFQGGVAYVGSRIQIEADLQAYSSAHEYVRLSTDQAIVIYGDTTAGGPATIVRQPYPGYLSSARGFANGAVGGHFRPWRDRDFRIHGGLASDHSPLDAGDAIFARINLLSWTIGASGQFGKFRFAAGVNRRTGTSDDIVIENLIGGRTVHTSIDVHTTGLIYSLSYQF
jgi:hypothetical protein